MQTVSLPGGQSQDQNSTPRYTSPIYSTITTSRQPCLYAGVVGGRLMVRRSGTMVRDTLPTLSTDIIPANMYKITWITELYSLHKINHKNNLQSKSSSSDLRKLRQIVLIHRHARSQSHQEAPQKPSSKGAQYLRPQIYGRIRKRLESRTPQRARLRSSSPLQRHANVSPSRRQRHPPRNQKGERSPARTRRENLLGR